MKIQDVLFLISIVALLGFRVKPAVFTVLGIICILVSIPLFSFWVFFTAQRLVYYSAGFIFLGVVLLLLKRSK